MLCPECMKNTVYWDEVDKVYRCAQCSYEFEKGEM